MKNIPEKNGRLYRVYGDMGTLKQWDKSEYVLLKETETSDKKTYLFRIPDSGGEFYYQLVDIIEEDGQRKVGTLLIH